MEHYTTRIEIPVKTGKGSHEPARTARRRMGEEARREQGSAPRPVPAHSAFSLLHSAFSPGPAPNPAGETCLPGPHEATLRSGVPLRKATAVARAPTQGFPVGRIWVAQKPGRGQPRNLREGFAKRHTPTGPIRPLRPIRPMEPPPFSAQASTSQTPFCILTSPFYILPGASPETRRGDASPRTPRYGLAVWCTTPQGGCRQRK